MILSFVSLNKILNEILFRLLNTKMQKKNNSVRLFIEGFIRIFNLNNKIIYDFIKVLSFFFLVAIVKNLQDSISCTTIGSKSYLIIDIMIDCGDQTHTYYKNTI